MTEQTLKVDNFLSTIILWATKQKDIHAILLVGSHARGNAMPTSDIDLCILVDNPNIYLSDQLWAEQFGAIKKQQIEYYGNVTSLRIQYQNSFEVEYSFTTLDWASIPVDTGTRQVIKDGAKILYDPKHRLFKLLEHLGTISE